MTPDPDGVSLALAEHAQVSNYVIATVYAALGDKDQAFARLNQASGSSVNNPLRSRLESG